MLTEQRKRFIEEYIRLHCKNATQAAVSAGYSPKSAASQASEILKDSEVSRYFEARKTQLASDLRQEFVFEASEAYDVLVSVMMDPDARDADKITAAKDILDRAGFKPQDKVEVSGLTMAQSKLDALVAQMRGG